VDTAPIPLSIETLVAFVVVHVKVLEPPATMFAGEAVSVAVGAGACTVTVAVAVAGLPFGPAAVSVYCVVVVGDTVVDPDTATVPTPLSIVTVVAFEVDQLSMAWLPAVMVAGETVRVALATAGGSEGNNPAPWQPDKNAAQANTALKNRQLLRKCTPAIL